MSIYIFILGLAVGSFLNAYIFRMRYGGSILRGRSKCMKCCKLLHWYELIPIVSFIVQARKCRGCKIAIDWQYPLVELAGGILFLLAFNKIGISVELFVTFYLLSALLVLFVYDFRYQLVPDSVVLPAIGVALIYGVISNPNLQSIWYLLVGTSVGAGFFAAQYYYSKGKWLGEGDIRIGALMGAMASWPLIIESLTLSYIMGGIVGGGLLIAGKRKFGQTIALGTFLTIGAGIVLLYGDIIWQMYWRI